MIWGDILPHRLCIKHTHSPICHPIPVSISSSAVSDDLICEGVELADGGIQIEDTERGMYFMRDKCIQELFF